MAGEAANIYINQLAVEDLVTAVAGSYIDSLQYYSISCS